MQRELKQHAERTHWKVINKAQAVHASPPHGMDHVMKRDPAGEIIKWKA